MESLPVNEYIVLPCVYHFSNNGRYFFNHCIKCFVSFVDFSAPEPCNLRDEWMDDNDDDSDYYDEGKRVLVMVRTLPVILGRILRWNFFNCK